METDQDVERKESPFTQAPSPTFVGHEEILDTIKRIATSEGKGCTEAVAEGRMPEPLRNVRRVVACLLLSLSFVSLALAGIKTDKEQAQLKGPVQTVRISTTQWVADQYGASMEGALRLESIATYERDGHVSEVIPSHPSEGSPGESPLPL